MRKFFWVITLAGCVIGGLIGVLGVVGAHSAPQEAAAASIAVACAVIPYCFARAFDELDRQVEGRPTESKTLSVDSRKCPYCAESIKKEAEICRFCKKELPSEEDLLPETVLCPACDAELELTAKERVEKKYECSSCRKHIDLMEESNTPKVVCGVCSYKNPPGSQSCLGCGVTFAQYVPLPEQD
jgi:DNA-directed RNA polymerase subunit RPC12/RpoP